MKSKICMLTFLLFAVGIWISPKTNAADFEFQPRLEAGWMYYSLEQSPVSASAPPQSGESSAFNLALGKFKISDYIGFVGGGGTIFFQRLFVDLSGQYAFDGSARTQVSLSGYLEALNRFSSTKDDYRAQFNRTDMALSAGYVINRSFLVYAGYKWATVDLELNSEGAVRWLYIGNGLASGRVEGNEHQKFRYEGPFIGITHGWEIDHFGALNGLISVKVALAFLSSKYSGFGTGTLTLDSFNGQAIDPIVRAIDEKREINGDTMGLTLGIGWCGTTAIKGLSYWIGLGGYRYNFAADDSLAVDVRETAVTFKTGLTYTF